jgi:hypothetical protein
MAELPVDRGPREQPLNTPLIAVGFSGKATIQKPKKQGGFAQFAFSARLKERRQQEAKLAQEFIPDLNRQAAAIADEIRAAVMQHLPRNFDATVTIQFGKGSVIWDGFFSIVAPAMGAVVDGAAISAFAVRAIQFGVTATVRRHLELEYAVKTIHTNVHRDRMDAISPLVKALWWSSGSVSELVRESPTDWTKYVGIGGAVVSTGLLASLSGGYALFTVFEGTPGAAGLALVFGLIWGLLIFNFDRLLVSSVRRAKSVSLREWLPAAVRMLFALVIAMTIAEPIEMRLFESEIASRVQLNNDALVQRRQKSLEANALAYESVLIGEIAAIKAAREKGREEVEDLKAGYLSEADGTGGSGRYGYSTVTRLKQRAYEEAAVLLASREASASASVRERERKLEASRQARAATLVAYRESLGNGYLRRRVALRDLTKEDEAAREAVWGIFLLIALLEISPILVKLLVPYGVYDARLQSAEETHITESELKREYRQALAAHHYRGLTDSERLLEDSITNEGLNVRMAKVHDFWQAFRMRVQPRPYTSADELFAHLKEVFFMDRRF